MNLKKLFVSLLLCFSVAYIGSMATLPSITTWYVLLNKPALNPPNWVFGPVWTLLYFLMAISFFLVWNTKEKGEGKRIQKIALLVFLIQLSLNLFWSLLFFNAHLLFFAFIEIIMLWMAILYTIILFKKVSAVAAYLLVPYLLWVSFASYLSYSIWILNP